MLINTILKGIMTADIPKEILELGFGSIDTEYNIQQLIIRDILIRDMNLLSYNTLRVDIEDLILLENNVKYSIYQIPPNIINRSRVIDVVGLVEKVSPLLNEGEMNYRIDVDYSLHLASQVYDSRMSVTGIHTNIQLKMVGDNVVSVVNKIGEHLLPTETEITFKITNEDDLSNIPIKHFSILTKLALLAVKSYLYRTLTIEIDTGVLYGGSSLDSIRNIIDKYETAHTDYIGLRDNNIGKIGVLSNKEVMRGVYNPLSF